MLGRILAPDYTAIGSRGGMDTRESTLASFKDPGSRVTGCVNSNMKVRIYGDAAVVTGVVTRDGAFEKVPYKNRQTLFTDTFVRRNGQWQCVASQGTLAAAKQK